MIIAGREIAGRLVAMIGTGIVIIVLALLLLSQCEKRKTVGKQAEVAKEQGQASVSAGEEAFNTAANIVASDTATDSEVARAQAEIAAAAKGQKGVAAKRAACRFKAYRNTPQCQGVLP
jgi:hypothetical protein